jgi:hypothetical protein
MRLTIEGTAAQEGHAATVTDSSDDLDIDEVGSLIRSLLLAWGFHPESVNDLIEPI